MERDKLRRCTCVVVCKRADVSDCQRSAPQLGDFESLWPQVSEDGQLRFPVSSKKPLLCYVAYMTEVSP